MAELIGKKILTIVTFFIMSIFFYALLTQYVPMLLPMIPGSVVGWVNFFIICMLFFFFYAIYKNL